MTDRAAASAASSRGGGAAAGAGWLTAALVVIQICAWTLLAARFEGSIDADVAEGVVDGPEWRLSYLRHPPLSSWLSGVASTTGSWRYFVLFAIALAFGCGAFALVSLFIRRVDGRTAGLVALLAGLGSPYATYWPLKFNHNIGVMPFWALVLWTAWNAFEGGTLANWALFGAAVGFGLWAKYAILHLVAPLGLAFLLVPEWRRRLAGPGPWLAAAIAVAIVAPQAIDVMQNGATTLKWATHTTHSGAGERIGWIALFVLDAALANAPMALIAWVACGGERLKAAIRTMVAPATMTRLDLFLHVAAVGPVLLIVLFAPFGVRIFYHWLTALTVIFAAWWGHAAGRAGLQAMPRRAWIVFVAWAAVVVAGYIGAREAWRLQSPLSTGAYPEMDGPALARLAERYWAGHGDGPIPYIVSFDGKIGFQAAGSIVFDLPYRVRALDGGDRRNAPWVDVDDLRRRGALVVTGAPDLKATIEGEAVEVHDLTGFARPTLPGVRAAPQIYFGVILPQP